MAQNIVENGTVKDHTRVLQLLGICVAEATDGRVVFILPRQRTPSSGG
jgi:hypothetical protein